MRTSVSLLTGLLAGGVARLTSSQRASTLATGVVTVVSLAFVVHDTSDRSDDAMVLFAIGGEYAAPLVPILLAAWQRRPYIALASFAVSLCFSPPHYTVCFAGAFVMLRDIGRIGAHPARNAMTDVGIGLASGLCAAALAFDLSITALEHRVHWEGFHFGLAAPRYFRMAIAMVALLACVATARGRTWGLLLLLGALAAIPVCGGDLPHSTFGCIYFGHPLRSVPARATLAVAAGLAMAPWVGPTMRFLSKPQT